jgi:hypothetical protein
MSHASINQARLLSATCRHLHHVGLRYIYTVRLVWAVLDRAMALNHIAQQSRTLCLEAESVWKILQDTPETDREYFRDAAFSSRTKLLKATDFLLSRPDLTQSVRTMTVGNQWSQSFCRILDGIFDISSIPGFFPPIYHALNQVLGATSNLTTIDFSHTEIIAEFLASVSCIKTLHTATFHACRITPAACENIVRDQLCPSEALLNLQLTTLDDEMNSVNLWHTLILYPELRTLLIDGVGQHRIPIASDIVRQRCNPFMTLERVSLDRFNPDDISLLATWISEARDDNPNLRLKLTHFKLHTEYGMSEFAVHRLLAALRWAPNMQVLVLEGLAEANPEFVDHIAHACPDLLHLTLIRRHNSRQTKTKLASWSHTSSEYACHFSAFTRLRHFGWNFLVNAFGLDPTPAIMIQFETGFADPSTIDGWKKVKQLAQSEYFGDTYLMAGLFAAHCPTLCTFAIAEQIARVVYRVHRTSHDGIQISNIGYNLVSELGLSWSSDSWKSGWPLVLPPNTRTV